MTKPDTTPAASASRHTPEPWNFQNQNSIHGKSGELVLSDMVAPSNFDRCRIKECVNALAGMNPEAVPLMIEALKAARTCLEIDCAITPTERGAIQGPSDALAMVNAALKGSK